MMIRVDADGNTYITGSTVSTDYPTTAGALQTTYAGPEQNDCPSTLDQVDTGDLVLRRRVPNQALARWEFAGFLDVPRDQFRRWRAESRAGLVAERLGRGRHATRSVFH